MSSSHIASSPGPFQAFQWPIFKTHFQLFNRLHAFQRVTLKSWEWSWDETRSGKSTGRGRIQAKASIAPSLWTTESTSPRNGKTSRITNWEIQLQKQSNRKAHGTMRYSIVISK